MSAVKEISIERAHAAAAELIGPAIVELARIRDRIGEHDADTVLALGCEYIAKLEDAGRSASDCPYPFAFGMTSEVLASVGRDLASLWRRLCDIERHLVLSSDDEGDVAAS